MLPKLKESDREKLARKKDKQKAKDDEKQEKRRLKEEKLRKVGDKGREREKKKQKHKQKCVVPSGAPLKIADFIQVSISHYYYYCNISNIYFITFSRRRIMFHYSWRNVSSLSKVKVWILKDFIASPAIGLMWTCSSKSSMKIRMFESTSWMFLSTPLRLLSRISSQRDFHPYSKRT